MKALPLATLILSLNVAASAFAKAPADKPVDKQDAPKPPPTIVQLVRAALDEGDVKKAEKLVLDEIAERGTTPIAIEAYSWLGRGHLAARRYDEATTSALRSYAIVEEQLKTRKLDDEPRLPIALGASIEVQAQAMAAEGGRSEAVLFLQRELERYKDTSIVTRLIKNLNLIGLEGEPAFAINATEWLSTARPAMADLKGKPVMLFLWAHWCGDCKIFGPILEAAMKKYQSTGFTVVAATQHFGYVARRQPAPPDQELAYAVQIRDQYYPWMKDVPTPVSKELYSAYGVSTSPTLVFIDRAGKVAKYNPGRVTAEELDVLIRAIAGPAPSAK